ncbi:hypothetical protein XENTR_v10012562 [Xenopus tropicalis]|nr:hypothetical protein XENTR_v10012562 [Xenopus tropicalis]
MKAIDVAAISLLLCLIPMSAVLAEDCAPYFGSDFRYHEGQVCILSTCSGSCTERFCSIIPVLDQTQFLCILTNFWVVLGLFLLAVIIIIAGIITCICKSVCCLCSAILDCLCCRKQSRVTVRQTTTTVAVTNVIPRQPMVPLVCNMVMPSAGYQPLPSQPMHAHPEDKYELPPRYPGETM